MNDIKMVVKLVHLRLMGLQAEPMVLRSPTRHTNLGARLKNVALIRMIRVMQSTVQEV
jgi:hypothetical protein